MNALAKIDTTQKNVLLPTQTIQQISPWHAARVSEVKIDPNPNNGEVFKVGSKPGADDKNEDVLYLAKPAIFKIASAAGITWNWNACGPVGNPTRDYVLYKAVGAIRLPDGSWQPITAHKEIDIPTIEEEVRIQYEKKVNNGFSYKVDDYKGFWKREKFTKKNGEEYEKSIYYLEEDEKRRYVRDKTYADIIQWRKNKLGRAESGAMLRVIRAALGMKSSYTKAELEKPFVVPRIDFTPDFNDPGVRQALIDHGVAGMTSLFGQSSYASPPALGGHTAFERPLIEAPSSDHPVHVEGVIMDGEAEDPPKTAEAKKETPKVEEAKAAETTQTENSGALQCVDCNDEVTEKVADYSQKNLGAIVCFKCQRKRKGEAA